LFVYAKKLSEKENPKILNTGKTHGIQKVVVIQVSIPSNEVLILLLDPNLREFVKIKLIITVIKRLYIIF